MSYSDEDALKVIRTFELKSDMLINDFRKLAAQFKELERSYNYTNFVYINVEYRKLVKEFAQLHNQLVDLADSGMVKAEQRVKLGMIALATVQKVNPSANEIDDVVKRLRERYGVS